MDEKRKKVLVWAVLPPFLGWRGEGIAQSIENILLNSPNYINFELIINGLHYAEAKEVLGSKKNVKLICFELFYRVKEYKDKDIKRLAAMKTKSRLQKKFEKFKEYIKTFIWTVYQKLISPLQFYYILRNDVIFNPIPYYSLKTKLKPLIFGFWDPFVFEHAAFGIERKSSMPYFWHCFSYLADSIVTQSEANKFYLQNTWGIEEKKIRVIRNGTPNYSEIFSKYINKLPVKEIDRSNIIKYWPQRKIYAQSDKKALEIISSEYINKSVLFRLHQNIKPNSKVFIVSTQYRPYKGFEALFVLFDKLIRNNGEFDFHLILTTELPDKLRSQFTGKYTWAVPNLYEFNRVTNLQHACLYKISDIALHPSNLEGGPSLYPASEAASIGIPSLTNVGRHTDELIKSEGRFLEENIANFSNINKTMERIIVLLKNENIAKKNVENILNSQIHWRESSQKYCELFLEQ
mgnify:CR=1 FL=1